MSNELELKKLELNKDYIFVGVILINDIKHIAKCSLVLSHHNNNTLYTLQFLNKNINIKPISNIILQNNNGYISKKNNFYLKYSENNKELIFYSIDKDHILGLFTKLDNNSSDPPPPCPNGRSPICVSENNCICT